MLFSLIAQIQKQKENVAALGTKGTVVDMRQITPQRNLQEPKKSPVKIAPDEQNDIKPANPTEDAIEERIKPFTLPERKVKVCVDQSAQTRAKKQQEISIQTEEPQVLVVEDGPEELIVAPIEPIIAEVNKDIPKVTEVEKDIPKVAKKKTKKYCYIEVETCCFCLCDIQNCCCAVCTCCFQI
jgi:hypothetical protein